MSRDVDRGRFYETERLLFRLTDRPGGRAHTVELAGTALTLPGETRFASIESIARYVDDVLALPSVVERFPRATVPVQVRGRRGHAAAHYSRDAAEIAVPASSSNRWAMRELVILHELAHHLDASAGPAHGPGFRETLVDLVGAVMGPEMALAYRVLLGDAGLG